MPMNILGMIGVAPPVSTSTVHIIGGGIDGGYITDFAQAHENSDFDAVLIGHSSSSADGFMVAQHVANTTDQLKILLAHRTGFVAPTLAARKVATLDNLTSGRILLHIITGGSDAEQRRDGDFVGHDDRYARTDEYLEVMRRIWTSDEPFDHAGKYYQFERAFSEVKAAQSPHVPLWFGGISEAAIPVGAKHCGTYALFGEPREEMTATMEKLSAEAAKHDRELKFNVSFRPIIADTEDEAWDKARGILAVVEQQTGGRQWKPEAETARRLMRLIKGGEVQDERLWVPIAAAAGGSGNTTALVGTPEQVAEAIATYYDIGISGVLIRGFDPFNDAIEYGRELIPRIRAAVSERDAAAAAAD